jgi:predicted dehydrogenase
VRALIVGLGSIGRRHARNWAALGLGEVWVCRQQGAEQPEPLGVEARVFTDLDKALAAGPEVVIVANPTSLHVATARRAVEAGAHVLAEKPLGHTLDGVAELLREAAARQRVLMVGYNLRFHPGLLRLRELLRAGAIGRPLAARFEVGEYLPGWHPWEDYRHGYAARRDLGGGAILTLSHELDTACWLLGRPRRLTCLASRSGVLELDTEDVAEITLQFDSALASVHMDYLRRPARRMAEITGEDGVLHWEEQSNQLLVYAPAARAWRLEEGNPRFSRNDLFLAELRSFADGVSGSAPHAGSDGWQGAAVLALALAALRSATDGRHVDLTGEPAQVVAWLSSLES